MQGRFQIDTGPELPPVPKLPVDPFFKEGPVDLPPDQDLSQETGEDEPERPDVLAERPDGPGDFCTDTVAPKPS